MNNPDQQLSAGDDLRGSINWMYLLAKSHATSITPFIRHRFGTSYPGLPGIFAVLMMFFTLAENKASEMGLMMVAWLVVVICHRLRMLLLFFSGWREHSHYAGWPWLAMSLLRIKDESHAKHAEPLLCLLIGGALMFVAPTVGAYIAFGCVSMGICRIIEVSARRHQVVAMQDLQLEQQDLLRRIRGQR